MASSMFVLVFGDWLICGVEKIFLFGAGTVCLYTGQYGIEWPDWFSRVSSRVWCRNAHDTDGTYSVFTKIADKQLVANFADL